MLERRPVDVLLCRHRLPIPSEATVHLKPIGVTIRRGMCHWMRSMTSPDLRPRNPLWKSTRDADAVEGHHD